MDHDGPVGNSHKWKQAELGRGTRCHGSELRYGAQEQQESGSSVKKARFHTHALRQEELELDFPVDSQDLKNNRPCPRALQGPMASVQEKRSIKFSVTCKL